MKVLTYPLRFVLLFCCLFVGCSFAPAEPDQRLKVIAQADAVVAMVFALDENAKDDKQPNPLPDDNPSNECTNCYGTGKSGDGISICTVCNGTGKTEWNQDLAKAWAEVKQEQEKQPEPAKETTQYMKVRTGLFGLRSRYVPQRKSYARPSSCSNGTCK